MKKYVGIIKTVEKTPISTNISIMTKFSDSMEEVMIWARPYSGECKIITKNNPVIDDFFKNFEDKLPCKGTDFTYEEINHKNVMTNNTNLIKIGW